jgi:hypothetical protein
MSGEEILPTNEPVDSDHASDVTESELTVSTEQDRSTNAEDMDLPVERVNTNIVRRVKIIDVEEAERDYEQTLGVEGAFARLAAPDDVDSGTIGERLRDLEEEQQEYVNKKIPWRNEYWDFISAGPLYSSGAARIFRQGVYIINTFKQLGEMSKLMEARLNCLYSIMPSTLLALATDPEPYIFNNEEGKATWVDHLFTCLRLRFGSSPCAATLFESPLPMSGPTNLGNLTDMSTYTLAQALQAVEDAEMDYEVRRSISEPRAVYVRTVRTVRTDKNTAVEKIEHERLDGQLFHAYVEGKYTVPMGVAANPKTPNLLDGASDIEFRPIRLGQDGEFVTTRSDRVATYGAALAAYRRVTPRPECTLIALLNQCHFFTAAGLNPLPLLDMRMRSRGGAASHIVRRWSHDCKSITDNDVVQILSPIRLDGNV